MVLLHTGTPSAGILFEPLVRAGEQRGLRHLAYSRPGYARSDRRPGRTVADCIVDVTSIADHFAIDRLFVVGWSGGGPHALACAALLGERVQAAATIASIAPYGAEGLDWLAGMGDENVEEFGAAEAGEEQLVAYLEHHGAALARATGQEIGAALGDLVSEVDEHALAGSAFADYMAECTRRGLEHGVGGWFDDDLAFISDWGFELGAIEVPVTVWQGEQDRFVPFAHGQWLAEHVAGARAELRPEHGHLSLVVDAYGEVLDRLLAGQRR